MSARKNRAEKTAEEAWEHLAQAWTAAGDGAGKAADKAGRVADRAGWAADRAGRVADKAGRRSRKLASRAGDRVTSVTDEALARASAAADALSGRRPARPWGLIIAIGLAGVAAGWAAASTARAALERQAENEEIELAETAVVVTPTYDDH